MSVARGFGINGKSYYTNVCKPEVIHCNFIVDAANGNGLGVRSLKSNGYVESVYMHTTASFTGTTHTGTNVIDGISGGTSSFKVGMPVQTTDLPAGATIASIVSSSSITVSVPATTGHAGATITYQGLYGSPYYPNPNPASGYVAVQFKNNFNYYLGGFSGFVSPVSGTPIAVTTGVTAGLTYTIVVVGTTSLGNGRS